MKKILFVNQEIIPYVPETPLAKSGKMLPKIIQEGGHEIRTFMPKWGPINERRGQLHEVIRLSGINIVINDADHPLLIKVASIPGTRVQVYFIDNDDYFMKRTMQRNPEGEYYDDNGERAVFFARGVLETVKKLRWIPDIIVCEGWMSAALPFYIKTAYADEPTFSNCKVVSYLGCEDLECDLGGNFKKTIEYNNATPELLADFPEQMTVAELCRLTATYSDGLIIADSNLPASVTEAATKRGVPVLNATGNETAADFDEYFETLYK